jgi:hypothetical protein
MSVFMQPIYTQTVSGSSTSGILFNNIPQGFADLLVIANDRSNFGGAYTNDLIIYPNTNGDTLSSSTTIFSNASTASSGRLTAFTGWWSQYGDAGLASANTFANTSIYIPNYTNATFKTAIVDSVTEDNSASNVAMTMNAHLWRVTNPITNLYMSHGGQTFAAGSTFTLYGISNTYDTRIPTAPTIGTVTDQSGFVSVDFTRAANDQAETYKVTSSPAGSTTYGVTNPITTPAVLGTSYTYQVEGVNSFGGSASTASSAVTTFNNYASIASYTFADNATGTFTFGNIPQNYKHLQMRFYLRGTASATFTDCNATLNNDTSNTYWNYHQLFGTGTNIYSNAGGISTQFAFATIPAATSSSALTYASGVVDFLDYTYPGKNRDFRSLHGYNNMSTSQGHTLLRTGLLQSTNPITAITITCSNFAQYSRVALYGIS